MFWPCENKNVPITKPACAAFEQAQTSTYSDLVMRNNCRPDVRPPLDDHFTKFRLRFDRAAPTCAAMVSQPTTAPFLLTGRKILIVDDDRLNIRILSGILKSEGFVLAEADSGERALEVYQEFCPDLVLL